MTRIGTVLLGLALAAALVSLVAAWPSLIRLRDDCETLAEFLQEKFHSESR